MRDVFCNVRGLSGFYARAVNDAQGCEGVLSEYFQHRAALSGFNLSGFNKLESAERIQSERIQ